MSSTYIPPKSETKYSSIVAVKILVTGNNAIETFFVFSQVGDCSQKPAITDLTWKIRQKIDLLKGLND